MATAIILAFACSHSIAQTDYIGSSKVPEHPRLLLLKGEEERLKIAAQSPQWAITQRIILSQCDKMMYLQPIRIITSAKRLSNSREALRRLFFLSYAWRITGNDKYLKRGEQELLSVSAAPDWNPAIFLDVAETTLGVSIAYDWLYSGISAESRGIVKTAILKKGLEPSLDPKYNGWLKWTNNWNQVCNSGMAFGALAIYEDNPQLAKTIINRAITTTPLAMAEYAPNGAFVEGFMYWSYGTDFNVMLISALKKAFGTDYGLTKQPGFLSTAGYMENMTGPTGRAFNYSDSRPYAIQPDVSMFWFANELKDPSLLWVERGYLARPKTKDFASNRLLPAAIIWGSSLNLNTVSPPATKMWVGGGENPVALMRTSWTDPNAIYVGVKGGSPSISHAHMDAGSFVMDANGERWAMDLGAEGYAGLESKGIALFDRSARSQRWDILRNSNKAHNTLTVNDGLQALTGNAPIISTSTSPDFMNAVVDLSTIYAGALTKATRGVGIVNNSYVIITDELQAPASQTTVKWTMLTSANVRITSNSTAELTQNGKTLFVKVQEPANVVLKTWSTNTGRYFDSRNDGATFFGFELQLPPNSSNVSTVLLMPQTGQAASVKPRALKEWPKSLNK
nr:heparinase II/III family protein [uncultured Mucilaginibacter sp.]